MDKRINVVFGATGRLGFALCLELKSRGEYVRASCREASPYVEKVRSIVDEVVFADVRNRAEVEAAVQGAEVVYHLAAVISIETRPPAALAETNVGGTKNVVDAVLKTNARLVYVSSVHALSFKNNTDILVEQQRYFPDEVHGAYAKSKAMAANIVVDAVSNQGLNAVIALPSGIIGPYEYILSNFGQMIADVCAGKMKFYMKGEYDFVDTRDVSIALADLADKGVKGESYNVSGHKLTVKELLDIVSDHVGAKKPTIKAPMFLVKLAARWMERSSIRRGARPTFTPYALKVLGDNCNFSHEKLAALTGYKPRPAVESLNDQADFYLAERKP